MTGLAYDQDDKYIYVLYNHESKYSIQQNSPNHPVIALFTVMQNL